MFGTTLVNFRELRTPDAQFPRRPLLGSSVNKGAGEEGVRPPRCALQEQSMYPQARAHPPDSPFLLPTAEESSCSLLACYKMLEGS